jgi:hypothetical protein
MPIKRRMGQFSATLRVPGDNNALPATVDIGDGRLRVESGNHLIGNWALGEIDITPGPEGVKVSAEGEVLILEITESAAFHEAAGINGGAPATKANRPFKMPNLSRNSKHTPAGRPESGKPDAHQPKVESHSHQAAASAAPSPKPEVKQPIFFDRWLEGAEKAVGQHLPNWVFTRGGAAVVLSITFPEVVSTLLMIGGTILLVLGGVTMLDHVLSARLLKAKVTPTQCLIVGGLLVFVGVVFGMLA